jgi:putative ABC transport system ATP-binding protein
MTATATEAAVSLKGVTKEFALGDTKTVALADVTLDLPYGEMVLLVGPSGCGKTTLISVVAGLLEATRGEVAVLGENLTRMGNGRKVRFRGDNIGFVFQQYNLLPALTAAENACVPLLIAGWSRPKAIARAKELLTAVGLGSRLNSYPNQLSGGQQQRVMELIRKVAVQPDRAVVVVTHDSRVYEFGDRIVSMADGRVESVQRSEDRGQRAEVSVPH